MYHRRLEVEKKNPLKRGADRTRARLRATFMLACLLAVICGAVVGEGPGRTPAAPRQRLHATGIPSRR